MLVIKSIRDCPLRHTELAQFVEEKWPQVKGVVLPKIEESLLTSEDVLPLTFVLLRNDEIIGFYQLIEHELIKRKDLSPWIAPLFIDEFERGHSLGSVLLEHARRIAGGLGFNKVYLATDHIHFYEKYGFREIGLDNFEWGRPTKLYEHDTIQCFSPNR
ncbi:GNAT family N-acetyltransferase [Paenibacillus cellulositrophicus]|uniref:GNAT family N-acetyltransferase n=1 Tax=Paenibacillus cellulositrophicus TaxID=562959 RepID=UPI00203F7A82|nr:GNAT family N-acetyltransferase [Paenibacillus cellulositrophicus]MCM2999996.1 GNAT family N-acetyltransferase [Paenibacillus cellulositrophicus]